MCSRASLGNWNMWVRGVQEDPPRSHSCPATKERAARIGKYLHSAVAPLNLSGPCGRRRGWSVRAGARAAYGGVLCITVIRDSVGRPSIWLCCPMSESGSALCLGTRGGCPPCLGGVISGHCLATPLLTHVGQGADVCLMASWPFECTQAGVIEELMEWMNELTKWEMEG